MMIFKLICKYIYAYMCTYFCLIRWDFLFIASSFSTVLITVSFVGEQRAVDNLYLYTFNLNCKPKQTCFTLQTPLKSMQLNINLISLKVCYDFYDSRIKEPFFPSSAATRGIFKRRNLKN